MSAHPTTGHPVADGASTGAGELARHARGLLIKALTAYRDDPRTAGWLRERLERLEQPLRIAITGRVNSGKSTLINALVGQEIAPVDAQERPQISTTYRYGRTPRVTLHTTHGGVEEIPVTGVDAATVRDLQQWRPDRAARLVVETPAPGLQAVTLVETTGVATAAAQETSRTALTQVLAEADAQIYLARQLHHTDLQFLRSLHESPIARAAPVNTILALARADEVGSGGDPAGEQHGALAAAGATAEQYRDDPAVRSVAQHVVPVVGQLGAAAAVMGSAEMDGLSRLAALPVAERAQLLFSGDRFTSREAPVSTTTRSDLLTRFGLFGVRRALALVAGGAGESAQLAPRLLDESGLNDLQQAVHEQLVEPQDTLRARAALLAVEMVLRDRPRPHAQSLRGEVERVLANAHEFDELRVLSGVRSGQVQFPATYRTEAERLLGAHGTTPAQRLGHDPRASDGHLADRAGEVLERWRERAMAPELGRFHQAAAGTVLRSCERLLAQLLV